jgi:hypothetical protein
MGATLQIIGAVASGMAQMSAARAQQEQYEIQARNAKIKGRQDAVNYKREGVERLRELNRAMAATVARAGAGGIQMVSGETKRMINLTSAAYGLGEVRTLDRNAEMAILGSNAAASDALRAGDTAYTTGMLSAVGNTATSVGQTMSVGGSGSGGFLPPSDLGAIS